MLTRGHIFLNTSLTEAFGLAILEAACAGLYVVSTRVGGVPEVLPLGRSQQALAELEDTGNTENEGMIMFAAPEEDGKYSRLRDYISDFLDADLIRAISHAIHHVSSGAHCPQKAHERVRGFYSWEDVTERTERVYADVMSTQPYDFWTRVHRQGDESLTLSSGD